MAETNLSKKIDKIDNVASLKSALMKEVNNSIELEEKLKSKEAEIKILQDKLSNIEKSTEKQVDAIKKNYGFVKTDEETKKMILELYAKNYSTLRIYNYLNDNGMSIEQEFVDYITNNLHMLSSTLYAYYLEQKKAFESNIEMNRDNVKFHILEETRSSINILDKLIDIELKNENKQEVRNLVTAKNNVVKVLNDWSKNAVEEDKVIDELTTKREAIDNVMANYTNKKGSFKPLSIVQQRA